MRFVLREAGLVIPPYIGQDGQERPVRHASEFWDSYGIPIHEEVRQSGDLIFFSRNGIFPSHIGIVRDEASYIHAPGRNETAVEVRPIEPEHIVHTGTEAQLYVRNPIGYKTPTIALSQPSYCRHQRILPAI